MYDFQDQEDKYCNDFTLSDIMLTLPSFVTTSVFESDAMLKITNMDHASLKRNFQTVFVREWETKQQLPSDQTMDLPAIQSHQQ